MRVIRDADQNPAYPSISIAGVKSQKNICGGILGIIFWAILVFLFIKKAIIVFGKTEVNVETFNYRDMS